MKNLYYSKLIIISLAGFLIVYHSFKIYSLITGSPDIQTFTTNHGFLSLIRVIIITSLIWLLMEQKFALFFMWSAIASLVTLQILATSEANHWPAHLLPLKGFIFPSAITFFYLKQERLKKTQFIESS